jgi:geranylgeranylglycerol-phosphate geranylgeranyltransferase|tara:strand:+ start:143 stop:991 length:849 start_codon:yes stop_codon:yes gene_type:complete
MSSVIGEYLRLSRPLNAFAAGLLTLLGSLMTLSFHGGWELVFIISPLLATILATAAGNSLNDYFDSDIDQINSPSRPIPLGIISKNGALKFSIFLFLIATLICLTLPLFAIFIAIFNFVLLILYTPLFKGMPLVGNFVVSYLGGSTILFGSASLIGVEALQYQTLLVLFSLIVLSTFSREIIKDIEDMEGDKIKTLKTLPLTIGIKPSLAISTISLLMAILISPLPFLNGTFGLFYLFAIIVADSLMAFAIFISFTNPSKGQLYLKYGMFLAIFSLIISGVL